ncbi:phage tail protein [Actinomadura sp. 21ATH]|uniref:phage tail protein n=1 Tax=Actinomadura sp. 21ATH TaxID=1735444 RepID=UPI0035C067D0
MTNGPDLPFPAGLLAEALADHPYDPDVAADLASRLFRALPAMYQVPDLPPQGRGELLRMLAVLAAPLAAVRQSVQELHADLFVDTADDAMVPYLAQMVGTALAFPDAASNRRDVRGTVGWRRRKGTPAALEEMAGELTGHAVVLQEGWKRVQVAQDLNLLRPERISVDVRPAVVAERSSGPLDALAHTADVRAVGARTGRRHPRHVAHWLFPTLTFPLAAATPLELTAPNGEPRFAADPLGARHAIRARRPTGDRRPFTDRIPERHFAADPGRWFGADGGFTVYLCGVAAAVAVPPGPVPGADRTASTWPAARALAQGAATLTLLDRPTRGWRGPLRVELGLSTVSADRADPAAWRVTPANSFAQRAFLDLDASGVVQSASTADPDPGGVRVVLLRLSTPDGAGRFFPGATVAIEGGGAAAGTASTDTGLAQEGFLTGALHVRVPPVQVHGEWYAAIALDGSLYRIADDGGPIDHPVRDGEYRLAPSAVAATGPGAAWPPTPPRAEPAMLNRAPAPGRGPAVLHGLRAVRRAGGYTDAAASARCALAFALRLERPGGAEFRPFQRLAWTGPDPAGATWTALDDAGLDLPAARIAARAEEIARLARDEAGRSALAVRFESSSPGASSWPAEVAWTTDDGRTVLVHLPQFDTAAIAAGDPWPTDPAYTQAAEPVRVGADGSTWAGGSTVLKRMSLHDIAPIAGPVALRRRRVRRRVLCGWDAEDPAASPPLLLAPVAPGHLDVDVARGLFALNATEAPRPWPQGPAGGPPAPGPITVGFEDGATMHLGALPAAREPVLDRRLARPTRLVCGGGVLHRDAPPDWHGIPRYPTLTAALEAVSATWAALTGDRHGAVHEEVVQFEDDATYSGEAPRWPRGPADPVAHATSSLRLTVQAAERQRPTVLVDPVAGWADPEAPVAYDRVALCGIALGGADWTGLRVPPCREFLLELTTVLHAENTIACTAPGDGGAVTVRLSRAAGLRLAGPGVLDVEDSVVDAARGLAVDVPAGRARLTRVSVGGTVAVRELDADTTIFDGDVAVQDRFHGCVRYSRATSASTLPRTHRVVFDVPLRIVSRDRRDPAWWRLGEDCDPAISAGAEDGGELGAFASAKLTARLAGFRRRLAEFTPAGLVTGIVRIG